MATIKMLVPIDFSETSARALAWAFDYATRAPCEVHLLHVVESHMSDLLPEHAAERVAKELADVAAEAQRELERMVPSATDRARIGHITHHVAVGKAAQQILFVAGKLNAEMIVMGTHGRSGTAGFLVGSVAEKIVRHAECPVVCVKPTKK